MCRRILECAVDDTKQSPLGLKESAYVSAALEECYSGTFTLE